MNKKIIIILISLLILTTGIVTAKNINDFKIPYEYREKINEGVYQVPNTQDNPQFIILKTDNTDEYTKNTTGYRVYSTTETPNTYYYVDEELGEQGCLEQIEVDGEKYMIFSTYHKSMEDKAYLGASLLAIQDFNNQNHVTPNPII